MEQHAVTYCPTISSAWHHSLDSITLLTPCEAVGGQSVRLTQTTIFNTTRSKVIAVNGIVYRSDVSVPLPIGRLWSKCILLIYSALTDYQKAKACAYASLFERWRVSSSTFPTMRDSFCVQPRALGGCHPASSTCFIVGWFSHFTLWWSDNDRQHTTPTQPA